MERINIDKIKTEKIVSANKSLTHQKNTLKRSIIKYGQTRPIVLNKNYEIVDGYVLYTLLKSLKYKEVYVMFIDVKNSDEQAYSELNILNDNIDTVTFFKFLRDGKIDLKNNILPFSFKDLNDFIKLITQEKKEKIKSIFDID